MDLAEQMKVPTGAHHLELAELGLYFARLEVDVGQGVEFVHHDVDVVAPDAC